MRLGVHGISGDHHHVPLAAHKEAIRLGQGEFAHHRVTRPAMERGLAVLKEFADIARRYKASAIVAVATAALREAENRGEFIDRARSECGVDIRVVSGIEEARLIYLGVSSGAELDSKRALFVDVGGGTTELILGDARDHYLLESMKLGAIRLGDIFLRGDSGSVSKKKYRAILDYVRGAAGRVLRNVREQGFDLAFGSSGTIMNLAEITARRKGDDLTSIRNYELAYSDLTDTISMLCGLDLEERRGVPGMNPERADIIISGAAILDAVMADTGAKSITTSDRALRDGILIDYLFQEEEAKEEFLSISPRQRSILNMCRSCGFEEAHANKVVELSLSLFRQLATQGLHDYGRHEEDLLRYAALSHDVGTFIGSVDHHKHSYYLIRNWHLLGFSDEEVEILATTAMCHRKATPRKASSGRLSPRATRLVEVLASVLRVADALDRSQLGVVREVLCTHEPGKRRFLLEVFASEECPLEMWWLESKKELFQEIFQAELAVRLVVQTAPPTASATATAKGSPESR